MKATTYTIGELAAMAGVSVRTLHHYDRPGFDHVEALRGHRRLLEERAARIGRLLSTIDRSIARLGGEDSMLSDEELYEGFEKAEIESIKNEAERRWGDSEAYRESRRRVARMSKEDWAAAKAEISAVELEIAAAFKAGVAPESPEAMRLMARKAEQLRHFYEPTPELFRGLGEMYVADERFKATYDRIAPGLAEWLRPAMAAFAARGLKP